MNPATVPETKPHQTKRKHSNTPTVITLVTLTLGFTTYAALFDAVAGNFTFNEEWANDHFLLLAGIWIGVPILFSLALAFGVVLLRNKLVTTRLYNELAWLVNDLRQMIFSPANLHGALSLISFGLALGAIWSLLGLGGMYASDEEAANAVAIGFLIPIDPIMLALTVPGIIFGTICRKQRFELNGFAQAGRIICLICLVASFTRVGAVLPLVTHSIVKGLLAL